MSFSASGWLRRPFITALGATLLLAACAGNQQAPQTAAPRPQPGVAYKITVLHTNDHHGRFWKNADGEGGMAAQKTLVDRIRAEVTAAGGYTLLLSGGDINTGVPESDLQQAIPDFKGMNLLRFDGMAVGNHEFDKPFATLMMQRDMATFPLLSANIYRDGKRVFQPYKMFQLGPVKVAVMGLTTKRTLLMSAPDNVKGLEFREAMDEAAQLVPQLRQQADVVIAATHMGHYEDGKHGVENPGDVEMARAVPGLDLVVGGHSHTPVCMAAPNVREKAHVPGAPCTPERQNGTWIVQAENWGKYLGRADFEYRDGSFKLVNYTLIPVNLKEKTRDAEGKRVTRLYQPEIPEDTEMLALLKPYQDLGAQKLLVDIGSTDGTFDEEHDYKNQLRPALAQLILHAMMENTRADFAVTNTGGIRDSLPGGRTTYKDVLKIHPFGNIITTVELTGAEVAAYMAVLQKMTPTSGAYPQYAGIRLTPREGQPAAITLAGKPLEPARTYRMVISSFLATGGDGYPKMTTHPRYTETGFTDAEVLRAYISAHSPLSASQFPQMPPPAAR